MKKTKIFAAYLPQYHEIEENNMFWGKGFTDWVGVKNAKPQYPNHNQPRVPLNNNYYDLSDVNVIRNQAKLAKEYGISGFNIYHYWFKNGKQVLQTPAELVLKNKDIDIEFFFSWDNTSWVRSWGNIPGNSWAPSFDKTKDGKCILLEYEIGDEKAWKQHFDYLLPFFKDNRYLKIDNKPVFAIMNNTNDKTLLVMVNYLDDLSKKSGFNGLYLINNKGALREHKLMGNYFIYEPCFSTWSKTKLIDSKLNSIFNINSKPLIKFNYRYDYKFVWKKIIKNAKKYADKNIVLGSFVRYDDTPRRGNKANVVYNESPEKFKKYFSEFYELNCKHNKVFLLLTAWNEWGEGSYLEPDTIDKYAYLEAIRDITNKY